ncbi:hypothetical protein D3C87_1613790 [compost metagenome]
MEIEAAGLQQATHLQEVPFVVGETGVLEHLDLGDGVIGLGPLDLAIILQLQGHPVR